MECLCRRENVTKNSVLSVKILSRCNGDEELRTVGARAVELLAGIRHGKHVWLVEVTLWVWLVVEVVAWAAAAGARWVSALNHEARDDAVKDYAVVERLAGLFSASEVNKVFYGDRRFVAKQVDLDCAVVGVNGCDLCMSHCSILADSSDSRL